MGSHHLLHSLLKQGKESLFAYVFSKVSVCDLERNVMAVSLI